MLDRPVWGQGVYYSWLDQKQKVEQAYVIILINTPINVFFEVEMKLDTSEIRFIAVLG